MSRLFYSTYLYVVTYFQGSNLEPLVYSVPFNPGGTSSRRPRTRSSFPLKGGQELAPKPGLAVNGNVRVYYSDGLVAYSGNRTREFSPSDNDFLVSRMVPLPILFLMGVHVLQHQVVPSYAAVNKYADLDIPSK